MSSSSRARSTLVALGLAVAMLAALAPVASAVVVRGRHGHFFGITLHRGVEAAAVPGSLAASHLASRAAAASSTGTPSPLAWQNGPVLHSSSPYLILWTPSGQSLPSGWVSLMQQYLTDSAADSAKGAAANVFGALRQYTDQTGFADFKQAFDPVKQVITDTDPYPTTPNATCGGYGASPCISDSQLQTELSHLISTRNLPTDGAAGGPFPPSAPVYMIVLPPSVDVCFDDGAGTSCAHNAFCAYHSDYRDGPDNVLYAPIPTMPLLSNSGMKACQADGYRAVQEPNGSPADVALKYLNHEQAETVTDPLGTGWYDPATGSESGDNCNAYTTDSNSFQPAFGSNPALYTQTLNGHHYYLQSEWSNGERNCVMQPGTTTLTPRFTATPQNPEGGAAASFDPSTSTSTYPYTSATWSWGDGTAGEFYGSSAAVAQRQHTYASGGTYTATLTLVDSLGNSASTSQTLTVYPTASFIPTPASANPGSPISFGATASDGSGTITSYSWDFGDGATDTTSGASASHKFASTGVYKVKLTVADNNHGTATVSQTVTVGPIASFAATPQAPVQTQSVSFDASGSSPKPGTSIASYTWDFGDGTTGTGPAPSHAYAKPGPYTVKLSVANDQSPARSDTATQTITVGPDVPIASFTATPASPQAPTTVTLDASGSSDPAGQSLSYAWAVDGTPTATGKIASLDCSTPCRHSVSLTVRNESGNSGSAQQTVVIGGQPPVATLAATRASALVGQPVAFDGGGSHDPYPGLALTYTWSFGDGSSASGAAVSHVYAAPGSYTAVLTVADPSGQSTTAQELVSVHSLPSAAFTVTPGGAREGTPLRFDGSGSSTSDPSTSISSYRWSFGDGSSASDATVSHAYSLPGTYTAQLTVTDGLGQTSTTAQPVTVTDEPPSAALQVLTARPASGQPASFAGSGSGDLDGTIAAYRWNFGDGASGSGAAPSHTFVKPGTYRVWLTVLDSSGQSAVASALVTVFSSGRITRVGVKAARKGATMLVSVNTAGTLIAGHRSYTVRRAGTTKIAVALSAAQLRSLARRHRLRVRLALRFVAFAGPPAAQTASVTFTATPLKPGLAVKLGR